MYNVKYSLLHCTKWGPASIYVGSTVCYYVH